jgi:GGDEF domain-containing protein
VGGDEFIVDLPGICDRTEAQRRGDLILWETGELIKFCGSELSDGASFGAAIFPSDGKDAYSLPKAADEDTYRAKKKRKCPQPNISAIQDVNFQTATSLDCINGRQ